MNRHNTTQQLLENFRRQGVTRRRSTFFGKPIGASPAESMVDAFAAAGVTRPEPSFFGVTFQEYAERQAQNGHPVSTAQAKLIVLPNRKRERMKLPYAA